MGANFLKLGQFNRISDRSGFKMKSGKTAKEWTNAIVGVDEWEPRNAQEFLRGIPDFMAAPDPRPEATDQFITVTGSSYSVATPAVPASGVPLINTTGDPVNVQITGTVTSILVNGVPLTSNFNMAPGDSVVLTYTVTPTWVWTGV